MSPDAGDIVRAGKVEVRGTVDPPAAVVEVDGVKADVTDGAFATEVSLTSGENTIDVVGTSAGAKPASDSVTVRRGRTRAEIRAAVKRKEEARARRRKRQEARRIAEQQQRAAREARRAADNYPAEIRQNFMAGCTIDATQSQCECGLEKIEAQMTLQQYLIADQLAAGSGQIPNKIIRIMESCA